VLYGERRFSAEHMAFHGCRPTAIGALIRVSGDVQGVGFRIFVKRLAEYMGLKGYVRNLANGSVEIYVEGDRQLIERFCDELRLQSPTTIIDMHIEFVRARGFKEFYIVP